MKEGLQGRRVRSARFYCGFMLINAGGALRDSILLRSRVRYLRSAKVTGTASAESTGWKWQTEAKEKRRVR
jgi:hypothetical protein